MFQMQHSISILYVQNKPVSLIFECMYVGVFNSLVRNVQVSITSEDKRAVESKGIGRKLMDNLCQTYCSELGRKHLAYDGEKSLFTVGPLPQNKFEFKVVLEESSVKRFVSYPLCISSYTPHRFLSSA